MGARSNGGIAVNDKIAAFVLYPGLTPLDLIGPLQVKTGLETAEAMFGIQLRHNVRVVAESLDVAPHYRRAATGHEEIPHRIACYERS
jgi:hypothetical protein